MRKRLVTEVLIIGGDQGEQSKKACVAHLAGKPAPYSPLAHLPLLHQGKCPPSCSGDGEGVGSPVFSNRNQL